MDGRCGTARHGTARKDFAGACPSEIGVIGGPNRCSGASSFGPVAHSISGSNGSGAMPAAGEGKSSNRSDRTLSLEKFLHLAVPGERGIECWKLYWKTPKVLSSSPRGAGDPTGMFTRKPLFIPRFTVTSKVARSWIENFAEEQGCRLATAGAEHFLALWRRLIRSCIVAKFGEASAFAALAAV
jgi:hypothetical protein